MKAVNTKILVEQIVEQEESVVAKVKVKPDSLLKGKVISVGELVPVDVDIDEGDVIWFAAYGYEEVGGKIVVDFEQVYVNEGNPEKAN